LATVGAASISAKKVGWLTAACNLAIKEGRLKFKTFPLEHDPKK